MSVSIFPFPEEPGPFSFVAWIATFYYPRLGGFEFVFSEGPRFVAWIATFYYPWLGGFFEFVFSEGLRPFFLCSLKSYVLLPVVGWIFWICLTQRTELWVYGEAIISQGWITFYLPGGTRSLNFLSFEVLRFYYPWLGGFFEFVFSEGLRPFLPLIVAWIAVFYYPWLGQFFHSAFFR